ncbi:MAG TPA: glycosyltransferase family 39 protein [Micromonosporaceae bacterium]
MADLATRPDVRAVYGPPGRYDRRRWWLPLAVLVVAAGVVARFVAPAPLWLDEAQSVAISRLPLPDLFAALREDGSPPLYYLLLHAWIALFGTGSFALRSLSGVFAVAALPLFALLTRRLGGGRTAMTVVVVLAATNPWLVRFASEVRMYSLMVLLVLVGALAVDLVLRRPGPLPALGVAASAAAVLYTHYWAMFLLATVGAGLVVAWVRTRRTGVLWALGGLIGGGLLFLPWLPTFLWQMKHTGTPWAARPQLSQIPSLVNSWATAGSSKAAILPLLVWPLTVVGAVLPLLRPTPRRTVLSPPVLGAIGAGTIAVAYSMSWLSHAALVTRYTAVVVPFAVVLLAFGVVALPNRYAALALIVIVAASLLVDRGITRTYRTQAAQIAAVLDTQAKPGDQVIFCPDQLAPDTVRLTHTRAHLITYPAQADPGRLDWTDYKQRIEAVSPHDVANAAAGAVPRGGHVFVVYGSGYAPFGSRCEQMFTTLSADLGNPKPVLLGRTRLWEHGWVWRWTR